MNEVELEEFLKTAVFYPCSGFDDTPVKILANRRTRFFHVGDYITRDYLAQHPHFHNYRCHSIEKVNREWLWGGEHGEGNGDAFITRWWRYSEFPENHGVEQFDILFAQCEVVSAFQATYSRLKIAPYCVAYLPWCVPHAEDMPPFEQALRNNPGGLPRYILWNDYHFEDGSRGVDYMRLFEEYTAIERPDHNPDYEPKITLAQLTTWRGDGDNINLEGANEHPAHNMVPNIGFPPWCGTEARRCQETGRWREICQQLMDPARSAAVRMQLVNQGASVVPSLIRILEDINTRPIVVEKVAWILGEIHDPRAREPLQEKVRHDLDPAVRQAADQALQQMPPLLMITTNELPNATNTQEYTAQLTAVGGTPPYHWLPGSRLPLWLQLDETTGALAGMPMRARAASFSVDVTDDMRQTATQMVSLVVNSRHEINALAKDPSAEGRRLRAKILNLLHGPAGFSSAEVRRVVAMVRVERTVTSLVNTLLNDENPEVKIYAAGVLLNDENPEVKLTAAEALLKKDCNFENAGYTLTKIGTPAIEPLIAILNNKIITFQTRQSAATVLGKIWDGRPITSLLTALDDNNAGMREAAARLLGVIGNEAAVKKLVVKLSDSHPGVRLAVIDALERLPYPTTPERLAILLLAKIGVFQDAARETALQELIRIGPPAVPLLIAALESDLAQVRQNAAIVLGKLGDTQAVQPLIAALTDVVAEVRMDVATALGKLSDEMAVPALKRALEILDEDVKVRRAIEKALARIAARKKLTA